MIKQIRFNLYVKRDDDIITWLSDKKNVASYIRELIRKDMMRCQGQGTIHKK